MTVLTQSGAPHTVQLYGAYEDESRVYLVQTLCAGGDVYNRIATSGGQPYTERDAAACVACVCAALAHAHVHGIVWLDLKLENMLICSRECGNSLLVADWGLARFLAPGDVGVVTRPVGTAYYCAPELLTCHTFGPESDCWSLGVATYIMLAGKAPFSGSNEHDILARIATDASPPDYLPLPPGARDFVSRLLVREPALRMTAAAALSHPWLAVARAEDTQSSPMDASVLVGLRAFRDAGRMRRLALHALAATFRPEELPALWDQYTQALRAGEPGGAQRLAAALRQLPRARSASSGPPVDIDALVSELDSGHEGRLEWAEFLAGALRGRHLRALRQADPQRWAQHVSAAFAALDADRDGFLTDAELAHLLRGHADDGAAARREADADGDGRVSRDEFEALLQRSESSAHLTRPQGRTMRRRA